MRSKFVLILPLSLLIVLSAFTPGFRFQSYSSIVNKSMVVSENSGNDFYLFHGITNNLTSYISPSGQAARFQTSYFGNLRYNWQDNVGATTVYGLGYVDPCGFITMVLK